MLTKITFAEFIQIETFAAGFAFATVYNRVKFYLVKNFIRSSQTKQKKMVLYSIYPFHWFPPDTHPRNHFLPVRYFAVAMPL